MGSKCEVKINGKELSISGRIDENFAEYASAIPLYGDVNIHLKDLISVNSTGLREWILLMRKMSAAKICLFECPKLFIDQVNMVKGVLPSNAKIMSLYVPYFNEKNGTEKNVLFVAGEHFQNNQLMPFKKVTDDKGDEMELDVTESKYFKFIRG